MESFDREYSIGITPRGFARSMVQIEKPMYGRAQKEHKAQVRWSATDAVTPAEARAMGEALLYAAAEAEQLQQQFDAGKVKGRKQRGEKR